MKKTNQFFDFFVGKKTYFVSLLTAIYVLLQAFGVVDVNAEQEQAINLLVLALFGITLRLGLSKK